MVEKEKSIDHRDKVLYTKDAASYSDDSDYDDTNVEEGYNSGNGRIKVIIVNSDSSQINDENTPLAEEDIMYSNNSLCDVDHFNCDSINQDKDQFKDLIKDAYKLVKQKRFSLRTNNTIKNNIHKFIRIQEKLKQSVYIVSIIIIITCFLNFSVCVFGLISSILKLHLIKSLLIVHQLFLSGLVFWAEFSVYFNVFHSRDIIEQNIPCLKLVILRGVLQLLLGALAIQSNVGNIQWLLSLILHIFGFFNVYWGGLNTLKLRAIIDSFRETVISENGNNLIEHSNNESDNLTYPVSTTTNNKDKQFENDSHSLNPKDKVKHERKSKKI